MATSIPEKKVDAYEDSLDVRRVKLVTPTDRGDYTGDGTPAAISVYVAGREYTATDNPGGSPVPDFAVEPLKERAALLGFKVEDMGVAHTDVDPDEVEFPGEVSSRRRKD